MTSFGCVDCDADSSLFTTVAELEAHIASEHLNLCPYECEKCRFAKFATEYALVSHCQGDHGLKEFYVRYRYSPENIRKKEQLEVKLRECLQLQDRIWSSRKRCESDNRMGATPPLPDGNGPATACSLSSRASSSPANHLGQPNSPGAANGRTAGEAQLGADEKKMLSLADFMNFELMQAASGSVENADDVQLQQQTDHVSPLHVTTGAPYRRPKNAGVSCQMCGLKVSNQRSSLVYHANTKHIRLNLYECSVCQKTWQTIAKSDVLKHVKAVHGGGEDLIIDNRKKLGGQLRFYTARCFPPKQSGRPKPLTQGSSPPHSSTIDINSPELRAMLHVDDDTATAAQFLSSLLEAGGGLQFFADATSTSNPPEQMVVDDAEDVDGLGDDELENQHENDA